MSPRAMVLSRFIDLYCDLVVVELLRGSNSLA
jgi:hypothetical protein